MLTAGIDLAAEPKGTALSVIDWGTASASLVSLELGLVDDRIVELTKQSDKIGIDCALGWPVDFVSFLSQSSNSSLEIDGGLDWRRQLAFRETDRQVRKVTGRWPLSVATDRLGMTALRCAGLLNRLQRAGLEIDRSGAGRIVEVYPAAALRLWDFQTAGYRNSSEIRGRLLDSLQHKLPQLDLGHFRDELVESCDAFDSLIASLNTRSAALGHYEAPTRGMLETASREGWIALPNSQLSELFTQLKRF